MLYLLTEMFLDILFGVVHWVARKTASGVHYYVYGSSGDSKIEITKDEYEKLKALAKTNRLQDELLNIYKNKCKPL